jgi:hypothetical protein
MGIAVCPKCENGLDERSKCPSCDKPAQAPTLRHMTPAGLPPTKEPGGDGGGQAPPPGVEKAPEVQAHPKPLGEPKDPDAEDPNAKPPAPSGSSLNAEGAEITNSKVTVQGNDGTFVQDGASVRDIREITNSAFYIGANFLPKESQQKKREARPLIELTTKLPRRRFGVPAYMLDDLPEQLLKLREERLVLISCLDEEIALAAAYACVEQLDIPGEEQQRMLSFDKNSDDDGVPDISFLRQEPSAEKQTAVVVDMMSERAVPFLKLLMSATVLGSGYLKEQLERNGMLLLCLADSTYVEESLREIRQAHRQSRGLQFTYWEIPFLQPLLKHHFPGRHEELERRLLEQRGQGLWGETDDEFCALVKSSIRSKRLPADIEAKAASPDPAPGRGLFGELFTGESPIQDTVLYVATVFQHLNPHDFIQLVGWLLGEQTTTVLLPATKKNEDGTTTPTEVQKERRLADIWREAPDAVMRKCRLVTVPVKDTARAITFGDARMREGLRTFMETEYTLFLENHFQRVQQLGLLFSPSDKIAENVIRLAADMAAAYPDYYGRDWLVEIIKGLENFFESPEGWAGEAVEPMFCCLREHEYLGARSHAYQRVSELLRRMLEEHQLDEAVDGLLEQLVRGKLHGPVLELVRRLRFVEKFDDLYWMKQLLDRGDAETGFVAYAVLYGHVRSAGPGIYRLLKALEAWLPQEDRPPENYSNSNICALRLLVAYCWETTARFDPRQYGSWPSPFPLFAVDAAAAADNLRLLTRWLFHPGLKQVYDAQAILEADEDDEDGDDDTHDDEDFNSFISALIAEWTFILLGKSTGRAAGAARAAAPAGGEPPPAGRGEAAAASEAVAVSHTLLRQLVEVAGREQRRAMLAYWGRLSQSLLELSDRLPYVSDARRELSWKRNLMRQLISKFKEFANEAKAAKATAEQVVTP